jgi:2-dehydropantoate 2-reductase
MAPHLKDSVTILSLQNGVDNAERLERVLNRPIVPVAVYVATDMPAPGHVRHHGRGELVIGPCPAAVEIAAAFNGAGIPTRISGQVMDALWTLAQLPYGRLIEVKGVTEVMSDLVHECVGVAGRAGVSTPEGILEMVLGLAASMPSQYSSTAQDLARGKTSEIDHLNGYVVRRAAEFGISTPANRALLVMIKLLEAKMTTLTE